MRLLCIVIALLLVLATFPSFGKENLKTEEINANFFCFTVGFGSGGILFPVDWIALFIGICTGSILVAAMLLLLSMTISHIIPVRILLPMSVIVGEGEIFTIGIGGIKVLEPPILIIGFIGTAFNIFLPMKEIIAPFILVGYSLMVLQMEGTTHIGKLLFHSFPYIFL